VNAFLRPSFLEFSRAKCYLVIIMDTQPVSITVLRVEPLEGKSVYAMLSVELVVAGILIEINGITARHLPAGGTAVYLPQHRTPAGEWRSSLQLPLEVREAICDQVLAHLLETGVGRTRYMAVAE
jgi:hypothetical protein